MTQSLAHLSAGGALDRQAGWQHGSGRSWSWELSRAHRTSESSTSLLLTVTLEEVVFDLTSQSKGKRASSQTLKPQCEYGSEKEERRGWMGGLLYFLQNTASSSCSWPLGSKAHHSTRAGYIPLQPSCGHPSLSSVWMQLLDCRLFAISCQLTFINYMLFLLNRLVRFIVINMK